MANRLAQAGPRIAYTAGGRMWPPHEVTLTTDPQEVTAPSGTPVSGDRLTVFLTEDAGGTNTITWASGYDAGTQVDIDTTGLVVSIFEFICKADGKWYQTGPFRTITP